jgi:tRNA(adenine34) deaminase
MLKLENQFDHLKFMREALKEAELAQRKGEVPVGAVVVCGNQIIARAHNLTETLNDPTAHAEMQAITAATSFLGGKYLNQCTLYVTLEPCVMCAGALYWCQLGGLVYGADDPKRGFSLVQQPLLHPKTNIVRGILASETSEIVSVFFKNRR